MLEKMSSRVAGLKRAYNVEQNRPGSGRCSSARSIGQERYRCPSHSCEFRAEFQSRVRRTWLRAIPSPPRPPGRCRRNRSVRRRSRQSRPPLRRRYKAEGDLDGLVAEPLCGEQQDWMSFASTMCSSQSGQMRPGAKFSFTDPGSPTLVDSSMRDFRQYYPDRRNTGSGSVALPFGNGTGVSSAIAAEPRASCEAPRTADRMA